MYNLYSFAIVTIIDFVIFTTVAIVIADISSLL